MRYHPDQPETPIDLQLMLAAADELNYDPIVTDFLLESWATLRERIGNSSLLEYRSLGRSLPWLYRLTFHTKGLRKDSAGAIHEVASHTLAIRFLPDYLRQADRFAMLRLIEPRDIFHPNLTHHSDPRGPGLVCLEVYPGMPLIELVEAIHDLLRWRIRQYDERDALNFEACAWGRDHVDQPLDDRPLFGRRMQLELSDSQEPT